MSGIDVLFDGGVTDVSQPSEQGVYAVAQKDAGTKLQLEFVRKGASDLEQASLVIHHFDGIPHDFIVAVQEVASVFIGCNGTVVTFRVNFHAAAKCDVRLSNEKKVVREFMAAGSAYVEVDHGDAHGEEEVSVRFVYEELRLAAWTIHVVHAPWTASFTADGSNERVDARILVGSEGIDSFRVSHVQLDAGRA